MFWEMTRARLIQLWFVAVVFIAVAGLASGVRMAAGTGVLLFAASLVPPGIVLMLWPGIHAPTVADVLYDRKQRD